MNWDHPTGLEPRPRPGTSSIRTGPQAAEISYRLIHLTRLTFTALDRNIKDN
ncbi:hypothetical protein TIFTF001_047368 [Ficus carica]|uniref:Uncharacterized protein n=1 Tax=Ficus carica TaxID=3494 RepID=A0AA87YU22_FICCA|nr:hypothetical protein TIFTF001_047338 [Ficus carica]GMN22067.1 hypothetical protein TIFTF001_047368 [Ficus carica]